MRSAFLGILLAAASVRFSADIGGISISTDFDAEFACAADMMEAGQRVEAERIFAEIARISGQPAWDARAAFVLALDDERRGDHAAAARRLQSVTAESIGLEAYRHLTLSRCYASAGRAREAEIEARLALAAEEPFAQRPRAGLRLARLLEKAGRRREALDTLTAAFPGGGTADAEAILAEKILVAQGAGDPAAARTAARSLLVSGVVESRLPLAARAVFRREEAALSPADLGRRARALLESGDAARAAKLLTGVAPSVWPAADRAANLLALAQAQRRLRRAAAADKTLARVPDDGTEAAFAAKLLVADLTLARLRGGREEAAAPPEDPRYEPIRRALAALAQDSIPVAVRSSARERLVRLFAEQDRFDEALGQARAYVRETSGTGAAFEPLFKAAFAKWNAGDAALARQRFEAVEKLAPEIGRARRLLYWKARCLAREGKAAEADALYTKLAAADPADLYAQLARRRVSSVPIPRPASVPDPALATAIYRVPDELLRLRMFEEAAAEARRLPASRGRYLRLAQAEFGLGHFFAAIGAVKKAFPQMGTAEETSVPDPWRRLYYPIEEGGIVAARAREAGIDAAILRGLVRQESVFDARARSKAGAIGLMQLEPATAKTLSRSVLRLRYRRAFLYDPGKNVSLGAAYLKTLIGQFHGSMAFALAAYNGGPP
ncbi:MAG TPA: lytic transglycosylase domain-containing protein, partial [Thermoanaerobaculia bacterium]|nr:lytic transglycosylase domain-containing protein [Thermoanaerobaculia bacterium]